MNFLDRLQDGLCENKTIIRKLMGDDFQNNISGSMSMKLVKHKGGQDGID